MRIQHNITAMNSYRNFSANTSNLSKNLEKLSSGYKINRAGDDAAGLAISEKMRAQITGIEGATKNSKDGISLIQTAEGALTEVHDMLNRMTTLAEQSANGTYQDELDREQLQKEVSQLKDEIDRIADSTNFNGLKLLDGSLGGAGGLKGNVNLNDTVATSATATTSAFEDTTLNTVNSADKFSYTMTYEAGGKSYEKTIEFTMSDDKKFLVASDGTRYAASANNTGTTGTTVKAMNLAAAVVSELQKDKDLTANFDIAAVKPADGTVSGTPAENTGIRFKAKVKGSEGAMLTSTDSKFVNGNSGEISSTGAKELARNQAYNSLQKLDLSNVKVLNYTGVTQSGDVAKAVSDNTFEIDGKKFVMIGSGEDYDKFKSLVDGDTTIIKLATQKGYADSDPSYKLDAADANFATSSGTPTNASDAKLVAAELSRVTGRNFFAAKSTDQEVDTATDMKEKNGIKTNDLLLDVGNGSKLSKSGKALDLQIGDTADSFNKLSVTVSDMHAKAIGIGDVDISTQEGAAAALDKIKTAINSVSDTRGTLGSLQNRLEHTINNLGVQRENIQNAESLIRDTDVAEEMMTYTKNNILNQSAQAMLAQANQLPQGVLQLLG